MAQRKQMFPAKPPRHLLEMASQQRQKCTDESKPQNSEENSSKEDSWLDYVIDSAVSKQRKGGADSKHPEVDYSKIGGLVKSSNNRKNDQNQTIGDGGEFWRARLESRQREVELAGNRDPLPTRQQRLNQKRDV